MAEARTTVGHRPVWVDLSSSDPAASRDFYSRLFGWQIEVNQDPQYGGYALARIGGRDVAGIGPKQSDEAPTAWMVYIGTQDAEDTARKVEAAGGKVIAPPFDVGDQGRMAVFQDPSGAFVSAWQPSAMEMNPMVPAQVPSYWMVYFNVDDVDRACETAKGAGAQEMVAPMDFPGG